MEKPESFYDYLALDSSPLDSLEDELTYPAVKELYHITRENLFRIISQLSLPYLMIIRQLTERDYLKDYLETYFALTSERVDIAPTPEWEKMFAALQQQIPQKMQESLRQGYNDELIHDSLREMSASTPAIADSLHATLSASLIAAWNAFTKISRQIWVHAVNNWPDAVILVNERRQKRGLPAVIHLSYNELKNVSYNVTGKIGMIAAKDYRFQSLKDIRIAFTDLFGTVKDVQVVFADQGLIRLENIQEQIQNGEPNVLFDGGTMEIDGRIVSQGINAVFKGVAALLQHMNSWCNEWERGDRTQFE